MNWSIESHITGMDIQPTIITQPSQPVKQNVGEENKNKKIKK